MKLKIYPMYSTRSNEIVKNQYKSKIQHAKSITWYFQSYDSIIAKFTTKNQKLYLDKTYWDYSVTTLKYLKEFLYDFIGYVSKDEIKNMIKNKEIILTNLNK